VAPVDEFIFFWHRGSHLGQITGKVSRRSLQRQQVIDAGSHIFFNGGVAAADKTWHAQQSLQNGTQPVSSSYKKSRKVKYICFKYFIKKKNENCV